MSEVFTSAPHHEVLVLLVQVAVLLFAARALGEIARRLHQPALVGEILAGVLLGPSLLSGLVPALGAWIVPPSHEQGQLLEVVSLIGVMCLLLLTGLKTDLALIRREARTAAGPSLVGILVPFAGGFLLGWHLPDSLLGDPGQRLVFALFVATAVSISAIPFIAKVMMDLSLMRRDVGRTILAAGMTDDAIGWLLLSIVAGLAAGGAVTPGAVLGTVGSVAAFVLLSFTLGRWLVRRALDLVQGEARSRDRVLTLVMVLTFAWGAITHALALQAVLGAFVMGLLFGQMRRLPPEVVRRVESMSLAVFSPIFFAVVGLKVNVAPLLEPEVMGVTLLVIFVATFGKVVGAYEGARIFGGRDHWTALSMGVGLNARGAMQVIVATVGLQIGVLTPVMFSIFVVMVMATSLMAPPALRWALAQIRHEPQELARLRREELALGNEVAAIRRVLIPVRERGKETSTQRLVQHVVERLGGSGGLAVTLLTVSEPGRRAAGVAFLDRLGRSYRGVELRRKVVEAREPAGAILDEAAREYDLLVLGATEGVAAPDALFHPFVDELVRSAPCPTIVVRGARRDGVWPPQRVLVPTTGSEAARRAAELAFRLADAPGEEVVLISVAQEPAEAAREGDQLVRREREARRHIIDDLVERGAAEGASVRGSVTSGADVEAAILGAAAQEGADLLLLGTDLRPGSARLYLGPRVERLLHEAPCPVIVVNWSPSIARTTTPGAAAPAGELAAQEA